MGIPINYYAVMDLQGFVQMVDMVGGIDVNNASAINDPFYATPVGQIIGFKLAAGPQHLNGDQALGYVRSRHGAGNNDWAREGRQQQVMVALLHKMAEPGELLQLPSLMSKLSASISTTFPAGRSPTTLDRPERAELNIKQVVLDPPDYTIITSNGSSTAATTCLLNAKVAELPSALRQGQPLVRKARPGEYLPLSAAQRAAWGPRSRAVGERQRMRVRPAVRWARG